MDSRIDESMPKRNDDIERVPAMSLPAPLRQAMQQVGALYADDDMETARIRAALLGEVMRLTPVMMAANVSSVGLVLWCFRSQMHPGLLAWAALLVGLACLGLLGWFRQRGREFQRASGRPLHRATAHAALLATGWAVLPLVWFPTAEPGQQLLVATLVAGMLAAGAYVLSPLPMASLAWAGILTLAALGALLQTTDAALAGVALLTCFYGPVLAIGAQSASRKHVLVLRSQAQAERQQRMLAVLLQDFEQNADEALWQTGSDGCLTHQSPRLAELLGADAPVPGEQTFLSLLQARTATGLPALREAMDAGRPFRDLPLTLQRHGGGLRHLALQGKRLLDEQGRTLGWRGVLSDVSERVLAQQQLQELAHIDSLTGLANRHTLRQALAAAMKAGPPLALLSIDLDQFKAVNDTLGHSAGDEVLRAVGQRLARCMRPGDLVARLGGDEFAVLMQLAAPTGGHEAAALAQRLIDALSQPIQVGARRLRVGASVGIALGGQGAGSVDELLVQADMALYAAKEQGRGRHAPYTPELGERSRRRGDIEQGLRHALQRGQFSLHWQPRVDIASWKVVGAEALLRWNHPELGQVPPAEFIGVAEQAGLIDEIGQWALLEACRAGAGALAGLVVSVNVSPNQLRDEAYVARVRDALREAGLSGPFLELEITESLFMGDIDGALERLRALRALGVRVALDDFGTGYSSLAYLRRFPFDTLKIDRAFVSEVLLQRDARAIVQTIASMGATLGMHTVCEGVETEQQLAAVAEAGCGEVQGYLVSRPQPLPGLVALLQDWPRTRPRFARLPLAGASPQRA
jgi:diguanylate cyclase (GGDEF)-like protein